MLVRIFDISEFGSLAARWDCVARGVPFRSWTWHDAWWKAFGANRQSVIAGVLDDSGELVGLAPFYRETSAALGASLHLWGGIDAPGHYRSILSTVEHEGAAADALSAWLVSCADSAQYGWNLLAFDGIAASDRAVAKLAGRLSDEHCNVLRQTSQPYWRIELPSSVEDYLASLDKAQRQVIEAVEEKYLNTGRAKVRAVTSDEDFEHAWRSLVDFGQTPREYGKTLPVFAGDQAVYFLRDLSRRWMTEGRLQMTWLEIDGRTVAVEHRPCSAGVTFAYGSVVDPLMDDPELESILPWFLLKQALEQGRFAVDLLHAHTIEASRWNAVPRPNVSLRISAPKLSAKLRQGVWLAGETMKNLFKTSFTLSGM